MDGTIERTRMVRTSELWLHEKRHQHQRSDESTHGYGWEEDEMMGWVETCLS
jgi:hypothetical protein